MTATASADGDKFAGRFPMEISRPMSATHSGFAESHGTCVLVFMSGDLAIAISVPIHVVEAVVPTATDDVGRPVPAPGQGVLGAVSKQAGAKNPLSALSKRRIPLEHEIKSLLAASDNSILPTSEVDHMEGFARRRWSLDWWQNNRNV